MKTLFKPDGSGPCGMMKSKFLKIFKSLILTTLYNPRFSSFEMATTGIKPRQLEELINDFKVSVLPKASIET